MKRFIDRLIGIIFVLTALISNADAHDMTMQELMSCERFNFSELISEAQVELNSDYLHKIDSQN
ncbi:MAG: hypothetical protein HQK63_16915 [Desulfamplus sp.]|nr:hypothetical protein [Desulfamplus sp.]MBF0231247.1 hypothetical protein [Desulfamplus sp.]